MALVKLSNHGADGGVLSEEWDHAQQLARPQSL